MKYIFYAQCKILNETSFLEKVDKFAFEFMLLMGYIRQILTEIKFQIIPPLPQYKI
jgi:hypothetical protein